MNSISPFLVIILAFVFGSLFYIYVKNSKVEHPEKYDKMEEESFALWGFILGFLFCAIINDIIIALV
jgi:hypothetical protein